MIPPISAWWPREATKNRIPLARRVEDRGDDGDVRQVGAAVVRVVDRVHVAGLHLAGASADHLLDGGAHRAEMHRDVWRVGDEVAVRIEQRARKVQPLTDIH